MVPSLRGPTFRASGSLFRQRGIVVPSNELSVAKGSRISVCAAAYRIAWMKWYLTDAPTIPKRRIDIAQGIFPGLGIYFYGFAYRSGRIEQHAESPHRRPGLRQPHQSYAVRPQSVDHEGPLRVELRPTANRQLPARSRPLTLRSIAVTVGISSTYRGPGPVYCGALCRRST